MRIVVSLKGYFIGLDVWPQDSIMAVIGQLQATLMVPSDRLALFWQDREMDTELSLEDYRIEPGSVLELKCGPS